MVATFGVEVNVSVRKLMGCTSWLGVWFMTDRLSERLRWLEGGEAMGLTPHGCKEG